MYNYNLKQYKTTKKERYGKVYNYPVVKKKTKKKVKKRNFVKAFLASIIWITALGYSTYVNYENFFEPAYLNRINNRNIKYDAENFTSPTLKYANNLNFMGKNLRASIPLKGKEKIITINPTGTNEVLQSKINDITAKYKHLKAGVYIYDYSTGKTVEINSDETFSTASIIKFPILLNLFCLSKNLEKEGFDPIDLNKKVIFEELHKTEGSGELQYGKAGEEYTIDTLAKLMMRNSDNSATNMLIEQTGGINSINSSLRHWGFKKTTIRNWLPDLEGTNVSTPKELATLLYNIDNTAFLPQKSRLKVKEYMSNVKNTSLLKSQIPDNAEIIHKTGDIGKMLGDAGIIYTPEGKKIIMVIMVKRPHNDYSARDLIQEITKEAYSTLSKV